MRPIMLLLLAALALPAPSLGGGSKEDYIQRRGDTASVKDTLGRAPEELPRFVASNIRETLYHELAHLLVDQLELRLFGPEEFAADLFAAVLINRLHGESDTVAMTYDVAAAYDAGAVKEHASGSPVMWGVHGTNRQRYYNFVCMMYGARPETRDDVARELGLPSERAETCEDEYALAARAWNEVIDRVAQEAPGASLRFNRKISDETPLGRFVQAEVALLNRVMVLPYATTVSVVSCDEVNAFYDPGPPEILICSELGDHLARLAN